MAAQPPSPQGFGYTPQLRRRLGLPDLINYGLVFMVIIAPMGIFGSVYQASGGMIVLAYAVGAFAMVFTAISYWQMVRAFPLAGSVYTYAGRGIAPWAGFLAGWAALFDYLLVPSLLSLVAAAAMNAIVPVIPVWAWIVLFLVFNTVINLYGIRMTALNNRIFLIGALIVLVIFLGAGITALLNGAGNGSAVLDPVFNADTFTSSLLLGAASVAVLSFLGFDAISMLAEENRGGASQIGKAMLAVLALTGTAFIAQTWVAALLVPNPGQLVTDGDPGGTAFYDAARVAAGPWLATLTAVATGLAWGVANNMVAQVATSRFLVAMGRDRQLPGWLAKVSIRRAVPVNATLTVAVVSLTLSLYMNTRADGITLLASLINFGAICAFITLHASVMWHYLRRKHLRNVWLHAVVPLIGAGILVMVAVHANVLAQWVGGAWIALGVGVLGVLYLSGRRPHLSGLAPASSPEPETAVAAGHHAH